MSSNLARNTRKTPREKRPGRNAGKHQNVAESTKRKPHVISRQRNEVSPNRHPVSSLHSDLIGQNLTEELIN